MNWFPDMPLEGIPGKPRWHCPDLGYLIPIKPNLERQLSRVGKSVNSGVRLHTFKLCLLICCISDSISSLVKWT